jgi:predicted metal-dependent HD superfamily phosphohydrolase
MIHMTRGEFVQDFFQHLIVREALERLSTSLPDSLTYHTVEHTRDVLQEAITLAQEDGLSAREIELLAIASAWHDIGYIHALKQNEPLAARDLGAYLLNNPQYATDEIELMQQMILDTALVPAHNTLVQKPHTKLSRYLLDADLANFGRDDFFEKSALQLQETGMEQSAFRKTTLALLLAHTWLTPAGGRKWTKKKNINIQRLKSLLGQDVG